MLLGLRSTCFQQKKEKLCKEMEVSDSDQIRLLSLEL